jgi:hypothetical protein
MLEVLKESTNNALGFKVAGVLTTTDIATLSKAIVDTIHGARRPIGLLADLSEMEGATWGARWNEMRFLQTHSDHVDRIAIVCKDPWQELSEMVFAATAFMQAKTVYCSLVDIHHAWHWVKMNPMKEDTPLRLVYPGQGLFQDSAPEFAGL